MKCSKILENPTSTHIVGFQLIQIAEVFHRSSGEAFSVRAFIAGRFDQSGAEIGQNEPSHSSRDEMISTPLSAWYVENLALLQMAESRKGGGHPICLNI